jgi:ethanolamine ammonia-lyase large subunit
LKVNRELGFSDTEEDIAAKSSVKDLSVDEVQNHPHGEIAYSDDELAELVQKQVANSVWKLHDDDIDDNFYSDVSERANQKSEDKPLVVE